jgi:hypothetical protein
MKPGERVIWLHSPRHSFTDGWRLEKIPGEIVRICRRQIRIRVWLRGKERIVNVDPENVLYDAEDQFGIQVTGNLIPCAGPSEEDTVKEGIN